SPDSPVPCAAEQGRPLDVLAFATRRSFWLTIRFAGGNWQPSWGDVQSQEPQGPDIHPDSAVACAANQGGDLHVCAIGKSGKLWHTIQFAGRNSRPSWGTFHAPDPQRPDIHP